jgi:hypothetical protein
MLALTHADEKANANSALKTIRKIHLTSQNVCMLLFCCRAAAIAFAPSSPTWLPPCKTHVGSNARQRKSKREFSSKTIRKIHLTSRTAMKTINHYLTRFKVVTRLISPVLMRAANSTQSAAETLQYCASISSLPTSNSLRPNFTFGMEYADAAVGRTLRSCDWKALTADPIKKSETLYVQNKVEPTI